MPNSGRTQRQLVWAVVALVAITLAAIVALEVAGASSGTISAVLASLAPTVAVLAAMRQTAGVDAKVERVRADTHALTNGLLDSKVRAGVAEVLPDELVDDDYHRDQRALDTAVVEAARSHPLPEDDQP